MTLLDLRQRCADFLYNGEMVHQIFGTSMGYPISPVMADFLLTNVEDAYLYARYLDDIFSCARNSEIMHLDSFNVHHPRLRFLLVRTKTNTNNCRSSIPSSACSLTASCQLAYTTSRWQQTRFWTCSPATQCCTSSLQPGPYYGEPA